MKKFKAAVIGCGNIFPMHAVSIVRCENAELVAVCDVKKDRADAKAAEFGVKAYYDYIEMLEKEDIDVVHISTLSFLWNAASAVSTFLPKSLCLSSSLTRVL